MKSVGNRPEYFLWYNAITNKFDYGNREKLDFQIAIFNEEKCIQVICKTINNSWILKMFKGIAEDAKLELHQFKKKPKLTSI